MQPAVRREQAEGDPALVNGGGRQSLEASDVVAPEAEPGSPTLALYAGVAASGVPVIYRSEDAGCRWQSVTGQPTGLIPQPRR